MAFISAPLAHAEVIGADSRRLLGAAPAPVWLEQSEEIADRIYENGLFITAESEARFEESIFAAKGETRLERMNWQAVSYLALGYEEKAERMLAAYDQEIARTANERHRKTREVLTAYKHSLKGDYKLAATQISALLQREKDPFVRAVGAALGAYAWTDSGYPSKAFELIRQGRDAAAALPYSYLQQASIHDAWAYASLAAGDFASAIEQTRLSLDLTIEAGAPVDGISILYNLALIASDQEEHSAAERFAAMEQALARKTGIGEEEFYASYLCAMIADAARNYPKAEACARDAVASPDVIEDYRASAKGLLAGALAKNGRAREARRLLEEIRAQVNPQTAPRDAIALKRIESEVLFAEGDFDGAMREFEAFNRAMERLLEANFNDGVRELRAGLESDLAAERVRSEASAKDAAFMSERVRSQRLLLGLAVALIAGGVFALVSHRRNSRKLAAAMHAAEAANRAKTDFIASMSHELRTPLNGVLGMAQALASETLTDEQHDRVETILESGRSLLALLNDVLDLSKIEAGRLEIAPVDGDLDLLIRRVVDLFGPLAAEKGDIIEYAFDPDAPRRLKFDPVRVRQCVANLVSNAVKFTENGEIHIDVTAHEDAGRVAVTIRVADAGIGMSEDAMAELFKPYSQGDASIARKYGGTGLGLAIARRIARMMDGDISAESEEGAGTTMTLTFIADEAEFTTSTPEQDLPERLPTSDRGSLAGETVLIVDDILVNRQVARLFLKPFGATIIEAASGEEALNYISCNKVDLVLLDVRMPGVDGYETARRIRAMESEAANVPIVAMTAGVMEGDRERCLAAGMDGFAMKPLDLRNLASAIALAVERRRFRRKPAA